jgi:hypothetical protein
MAHHAWHMRCTVPGQPQSRQKVESPMLWTVVVLLLVLWALGLTLKIAGGLIHILLVIALIVVIFRLLTGRRVV